jgi:tRNA (adenine57-N1/adenine58-N1)-methyltransferase
VTSETVQAGDRIILFELDTGRRHLVVLDGKGARQQRGVGVFDPGKFVGKPYGTIETLGSKRVALLRPGLDDLVSTLQRKAQIITPKDASRIAFELGVGPGDRVFECGIGSGAATMVLLWAVGENGKVVAQDLRAEFADFARDNIAQAGLADRLETYVGDVESGLAAGVEGRFQAALLDLPQPWVALPHLLPKLAAGANVACYCPQVVQIEETVRALRSLGFASVRALELIERAWEVKERGSRPSFDGLGHTGFLVFARWLGSPAPPPTLA